MPSGASLSKDDPREKKLFSRQKWRDKLFAGENKKDSKGQDDKESTDQDIANFLGNSTLKDEDRLLDQAPSPWPEDHEATQSSSQGRPRSPPPPQNIYHRARPRQNKGLHVGFATTAPQIIGEGGDEADAPPNIISARKFSLPELSVPAEEPYSTSGSTPPKVPPKPSQGATQGFQRPSLALSPSDQGRRLRRRSVQDIGDVHPNVLQNERPDKNGFPSPVSPVSPISDDENYRPPNNQYGSQQDSSSLRIPSPSDPSDAGNSLTPRVSPEPSSFTGGLLEDRVHTDKELQRMRKKSPSDSNQLLSPTDVASEKKPVSASFSAKQKSLRDVAKTIGLEAIDEFDMRVSRFFEIFRLGVSTLGDPMNISFGRWLRTAMWWFLKGRGELEAEVRTRYKAADISQHTDTEVSVGLRQAYVDLAKAWWIVKDITPNHPDIRRYGNTSVKSMVAILHNFGNRELASLAKCHVDIVANLRALAMSMKRNNRLPPETLEIQRLDIRVLYESARLPHDIASDLVALQTNLHDRSLNFNMPLGDTSKFFAFSRMFGSISMSSKHDPSELVAAIPCLVSLLRSKNSTDLTILISSQDESINISIEEAPPPGLGLAWKNVSWKAAENCLQFTLSNDTVSSITLPEADFKGIWSICDYTRKVQKDFQGRRGEEVAYEATLQRFQCLKHSSHASSFPTDPIAHCRIRLFSIWRVNANGSGRIRAGHRLMAKSPSDIKSLSSISQEYNNDMPTLLGFDSRDDAPRLSVRIPGASTFVLSFHHHEDLNLFFDIFLQRQPAEDELRSTPLTLKGLQIVTEDPHVKQDTTHLQTVQWQQVKVISRRPPMQQISSPTDRFHKLRLILKCDVGYVTDCMGLRPGELQMSLSVHDCNVISLFRPPQKDIFAAITDYDFKKKDIDQWRNFLGLADRSYVIKTFRFTNLSDLHTFEYLVLGFNVVFEGVATRFTISRKRKGVPIHKQWEADFARLQILKHERNIQLVVFFRDFSHGDCMNFVLKSTDVFEKSDKADDHNVRLVDAKFALPKGPDEPSREYVSLDLPDYPSEHDDVIVGFSDEAERDKFAAQMPAAVGKASKLASLKR